MSERDEFVEGGGAVTDLATPSEPEVLLRSRGRHNLVTESVPSVSLRSHEGESSPGTSSK